MKRNYLISLFFIVCFYLVGGFLLSINTYGLFQNIRPTDLESIHLRFGEKDLEFSHEEVLFKLDQKLGLTNEKYVDHVTETISKGLAHLNWLDYDPEMFHQHIPIWENYFLYFMGVVTNIPEYQRYHFADYEKSLERGIGICGDASMIMSQVLNKAKINNQIVSFPGHVAIEVDVDGKLKTYDPDFGVSIPYSINEIHSDPELISSYYKNKGYSNREVKALKYIYKNEYNRWDDTAHFITKKYYFEKISYWLKWPFPILLIFIAFYFHMKLKKRNTFEYLK